jgi:hypothetical protein
VVEAEPTRSERWISGIPYTLVCIALGLALGWLPKLVHGPIPEKFDVYYINGSIVIWACYSGRMLIGFWVGISTWPAPWYLRGPLCGFLSMLPPALVALGIPNCGFG